jgi:hypothetical protein
VLLAWIIWLLQVAVAEAQMLLAEVELVGLERALLLL